MADVTAFVLQNFNWLLPIVLFIIGWYFGTRAERRHLAQLKRDEAAFSHIRVSTERFVDVDSTPMLVMGSVVIAQDRFKLVAAQFLSLFGANLTVYESLLERARREAVLRMKRHAQGCDCQAIFGLRFEMSQTDEGGVEVLAYGTGVSGDGEMLAWSVAQPTD